MCLHFSLSDTDRDIVKTYGGLPSDGPYALVNGGGGQGIIWGRSKEIDEADAFEKQIQGIYNSMPSHDGRGSVTAMNFAQTLNVQTLSANMVDPVVSLCVAGVEQLSQKWHRILMEGKYINNGKLNFPVYTYEEYNSFPDILHESIDLISALQRKVSETAARITSDLAPAHIRKQAEYAGALVYRFSAIESLVDALYHTCFVKPVNHDDIPGLFVVTAES